jgi:hypothetical protein
MATDNGTLLDEPTTAPKKPEPVALRSVHDYTLTERALVAHVADLKALAKKNSDGGYPKEARAVQADADAIEHHVLPQFRAQRELPLVSHADLEKEVRGALSILVSRGFEGLAGTKIIVTPENVAGRKTSLLDALTQRVTLYAKELADNAFNQGVAARAQSAEALAVGAISTLRASGD